MAATDKVYILAENSLKSTVQNRQLDVTATGAAGIDWGNVENPTTAVDLSATDIQLCDTTTTNTDMRGTDSAALASVCTETRLAELDAANLITDVANVKTDTASILADTGTDGVALADGAISSTKFAAGGIDAAAVAADLGYEFADALLNRNVAGGSNTGRLVKEALYLLRNKAVISGGTLTVYQTDDTTSQWTAAIGQTAGDPISSVDPV